MRCTSALLVVVLAVAACGGKHATEADCKAGLEAAAATWELVGKAYRASPPPAHFGSEQGQVLERLPQLHAGGPIVDLSKAHPIYIGAPEAPAGDAGDSGDIVLLVGPEATLGQVQDVVHTYGRSDEGRVPRTIAVAYRLPNVLADRPRPQHLAHSGGSVDIVPLSIAMDAEIKTHCPALGDSHTVLDDPGKLVDFAPKVRACACETDADLVASMAWLLAPAPFTTVALLPKGAPNSVPWPKRFDPTGFADATKFWSLAKPGEPVAMALPPDPPPPPPPPKTSLRP